MARKTLLIASEIQTGRVKIIRTDFEADTRPPQDPNVDFLPYEGNSDL